MTSFIDPLIAFVSAHAWLAYLTLFLAALLEAVPVVGSVIPGSTIILALSALVPGGELRLEWVLAAAIAGALLGDGSAFWIGHRAQREILSAWPMTNYPRVVAQSEAFFHRWGALAVFFARFVPPIRAFVPITAGALGMSPLRFYAVNIPAILLWAPAHVLPGVLAVSVLHEYAGVPRHTGIAKHYWMLAVIGGALIVALATWTIRRRHGGGGSSRRRSRSERIFARIPARKMSILPSCATVPDRYCRCRGTMTGRLIGQVRPIRPDAGLARRLSEFMTARSRLMSSVGRSAPRMTAASSRRAPRSSDNYTP